MNADKIVLWAWSGNSNELVIKLLIVFMSF